ncbi:B12-binding domain/radical SAM domain protein [Desulfosoma caldarium]|uniref:B12-binding domain/radical SAM domain protein n=1 Tax=Desulfosoma caldarium TaxID=610254 RepID=A0A3N1VL54_9BACT|nr:B12-binding domain/radical SAM domain protein [Desulfosoma caldarium]
MESSIDRTPHAIVFRSQRWNRYSFLALLASLEARQGTDHTPILWLNARTKAEAVNALHKWLHTYDRLLVLYSFMTPQWPETVQEVRDLQHLRKSGCLTLAAGGPHPSASPRSVLHAGFDVVCRGDGEPIFPELIRQWAQKACLNFLPGLYLDTPFGVVFTGHPLKASLEDVPALPVAHGMFGPIEISRGCPYGCRYCQTPRLKGRTIRHRSLTAIFHAVEAMVEAGRMDLRFITPNALAYGSPDGRHPNVKALKELLSGLRHRVSSAGRIFFGTFPSEVRPEWVQPQLMELVVRYADNRQIVMGAQSGDPHMLQRMHRGHSVEDVRKACAVAGSFGLRPVVDFILGLPEETEEQMSRSVDFMEELAEKGARIHAHTFMPLPGSPWAARKPEPIPDTIQSRMERLISQGKLFGQWKAQAQWSRQPHR